MDPDWATWTLTQARINPKVHPPTRAGRPMGQGLGATPPATRCVP